MQDLICFPLRYGASNSLLTGAIGKEPGYHGEDEIFRMNAGA